MRRIGVFGGTFDPPHVGHLIVAEWARVALRLDRVVFVPAGTPPHKPGRGVSPARHRVAMTRLAVHGHPAFEVSTIETRRSGPSFTVDTLRALRAAHARARLFLMIGGDSLDEFHTWHDPEGILALATLAVMERDGPAGARAHGAHSRTRRPPARRVVRVGNPLVALSSSGIRGRAKAGRSVRYLVPETVRAYLMRHRLYRAKPSRARSAAKVARP